MNDKQTIKCSVTLTNTGKCEGAEVVQLYIKENQPSVLRPEKELKRFEKVSLKPGENRILEFIITSKDLAFGMIRHIVGKQILDNIQFF